MKACSALSRAYIEIQYVSNLERHSGTLDNFCTILHFVNGGCKYLSLTNYFNDFLFSAANIFPFFVVKTLSSVLLSQYHCNKTSEVYIIFGSSTKALYVNFSLLLHDYKYKSIPDVQHMQHPG